MQPTRLHRPRAAARDHRGGARGSAPSRRGRPLPWSHAPPAQWWL